jgi:uncharacterized delta-60 repeat protein/gliding motility-associated-like protein
MKPFLFILFLLIITFADAQDGSLDASFGISGNGIAKAPPPGSTPSSWATSDPGEGLTKIAVQPDGKIIQTGHRETSLGNDFVTIRYNADGSPDYPFGIEGNGIIVTDLNGGSNDKAHSVAIQADGKIVVAGESTIGSKNVMAIVRYNADGTLDNTFNGNGKVIKDLNANPSGAFTVEIQPDGKILVAGWGYGGANKDFAVLRFNPDGSPDTGFGSAGIVFTDIASNNDAAADIEVLSDGKILAGGWGRFGANDAFALVKYNSNGTLDNSFDGDGKAITSFSTNAHGITLDVFEDKIYFTGTSTDFTIVSYNLANGTLNTNFGGGIVRTSLGNNDSSRSLIVQCDGKILVGGDVGSVPFSTNSYFAVLRYFPNGTLDNTFNGSGIKTVDLAGLDVGFSGLAFQNDKILMGGINFPNLFSVRYNPVIFRLNNSPSTVTGTITPASASICPGGSQLLTVTGGTSYQWSLNGSVIPGATGATYTATQTGTYSAVISSGSCSGNASNTVTITAAAPPTGSINPQNPSFCQGGLVQLNAPAGFASYKWFKDGSVLTETSDKLVVSQNGNYKAEFTNAGGCTGTAATTVTVSPNPTLLITSPAASCAAVDITAAAVTTGSDAGLTYTYWKDNAATTVQNNPNAITVSGTYYIKGTTAGGCFSIKPVIVTVNAAPTGTIAPSSAAICPGGRQTLTVGGGTSYQWFLNGTAITGATASGYDATQAGTYSVVIYNGSCSAPASNQAMISVSNAPNGSITPSNAAICAGGSQVLTTSGGTSYQWFKDGVSISGATQAAYTATSAGTYSVVISNGSCSGPASNTAVISVNNAPTGTITPATSGICLGESQTLTATGGTSYQWYKDGTMITGETAATYQATQAGTYTVIITNGSCSGPASNSATVTLNAAPVGSVTPASVTICPGGSATLTATGGTSYQWYKDGAAITGAASATYQATAAGTYSVTIIKGNCSGPASNTATVTEGNIPSGTITPAFPSFCPDGSVQLTGPANYTSYQWFREGVAITGAVQVTYTASQAGVYSVDFTANGCRGSASTTVTAGNAVSGSITPATATVCAGGPALLTVNGGTSYQWYKDGIAITGATSANYTATQAGIYSADIFNGSCSGKSSNNATVTVSSPTGSITPANAGICSGASITLTADGGTSYQWFKDGISISNATSETLVVTEAGTYTTDIFNGSCKGKATNEAVIKVTETPSGFISPATSTICSNGAVALSVNGGNAYQWYRDGTAITGATSANYIATQAGIYSADIINGSCKGKASNTSVVTVGSAPSGTISPSVATLCSGSSLTLTVSGGTAYQWYRDGMLINGATKATYDAAAAGTYTADIINGDCRGKASNEAVITAGSSLSGTISPSAVSVCTGGSVMLTVNGGSSYQWYKDGVAITGAVSATYTAAQAGTYSADIFNGGCTGKASNQSVVTITSPPAGSITPASATICTGGAVTLTANGGTSYQWYKDGVIINGAITATYSAIVPGTYSADITGNGGCTGKASNDAVVSSGNAPSGSITPATATICTGGTALLTVSGGTSYQWYKDGTAIAGATQSVYTVTAAGVYSADIINGNCKGKAANEVAVTAGSTVTGSITPATATICSGGAATLTVSGGTSYQWYRDGTAVAGAKGETYTATASGVYAADIFSGSCVGKASNEAIVTVGNAVTAVITPATAAICPGGSQLLTAGGGTSYQWYRNAAIIPGAVAATYMASQEGTYSVTVNNGSCSGAASNQAVITATTAPAVTITATGPVTFCTGGSVTLQADNAAAYQWYKNNIAITGATNKTFTATAEGVYKVVATTSGNCSSNSNEITVTLSSVPSGFITTSASSPVICPGAGVMLTATGGTAYQWYADDALIAGATSSTYQAVKAGRYSVTIFNGSGCSGKASNEVTLTLAKKPVAGFSFHSSCQNQPTVFENNSDTTNSGKTDWLWNFGDNSSSDLFAPAHTYRNAGTATVLLVATSNSCPQLSDTAKKEITTHKVAPGISYFPVRTVKGKPYTLSARNIGQKYLWQPAADLDDPNSRTPVITPVQERSYLINITSAAGCITVDTLLVQVLDRAEVFVPKAFTPNRNGVNDVLRPIPVSVPLIVYFRIYNRWGQLVFETQTVGEGWNGMYKGVAQPADTYTWTFEGKDTDGNTIRRSGKSILIR